MSTPRGTRRTPTQLAQATLTAAQGKLDKAQTRVERLTEELLTARAAVGPLRTARDYAAQHPALGADHLEPTDTDTDTDAVSLGQPTVPEQGPGIPE